MVWLCLVWAFFSAGVFASPVVKIGTYVYQLSDLSYKNESFDIDMSVWFRWTDPKLKPHKTFKIRDAKVTSQRVVFEGLVPGTGEHYAMVDLSAQVNGHWNLRDYPFDRQNLVVSLEDAWNSADTLRYEADTAHMPEGYPIKVPGWRVTGMRSQVAEIVYPSDFGYPEPNAPKSSTSSEFRLTLDVARLQPLNGLRHLVAPLVGILIILGLSARVGDASWRLMVITMANFALVSSEYGLVATLPESDHWSLAEKLCTLGLIQGAVLTAALLGSIKVEAHNPLYAKRMEQWGSLGVWGLTALFAAHVAVTLL